MRIIIVLTLLAWLASACNSNQGNSAGTKAATAAVANKTITLAVEGMSCTGCENTIKEAVGAIDGVKEVAASHTEGTTLVKFDSTRTDVKAISAAITEAGYEVKGEKSPAGQPASN